MPAAAASRNTARRQPQTTARVQAVLSNATEAWARPGPCSSETSNSWSIAMTQARTVLGATPTLRAASAALVRRRQQWGVRPARRHGAGQHHCWPGLAVAGWFVVRSEAHNRLAGGNGRVRGGDGYRAPG